MYPVSCVTVDTICSRYRVPHDRIMAPKIHIWMVLKELYMVIGSPDP